MTINDPEWRNSPYFAFFSSNSFVWLANFVTVVEDRPIMSVNIVSQTPSSSLPPLAITNPPVPVTVSGLSQSLTEDYSHKPNLASLILIILFYATQCVYICIWHLQHLIMSAWLTLDSYFL